LLRLPVSTGTATQAGLVIIQIDGLSRAELELALRRGKMPFLQRLLRREHYHLQSLYAGVPSTTPAMQGELFYGVSTIVPGFNFMQQGTQRLVRMFEPGAAFEVEQKLQMSDGAPLLEGGSCYSDNFTGGAAEPHFCPSSAGWGPALRNTHPLVRLALILSNAYSFVRATVLLLLELLLALVDFGRGLIEGRDLKAELKFIPTRVLIVILLRELITIGVKIDIARGLPVIHLNFLGYDEHAHRRGPGSLFAHWTLKGIDDAIARIWRASHRSERRSYDVWIYSDHGQQQVQAYEAVCSRSFTAAAAEVFTRTLGYAITVHSSGRAGIQLQRIRMFGGARTQALFARGLARIAGEKNSAPTDDSAARLTIAELGPVAHLYYSDILSEQQLSELAAAFVAQAKIPLVLHRNAAGEVRATAPAGEFALQDNPAAVLGASHPYLDAACKDLIAVCQHPDVVALQELDVGRGKTNNVDQAHMIASYLQMNFHFHAVLQVEEENYGNAILSHLPMQLRRAATLPGLAAKPRLEPRGALWVAIDIHGTQLQLINTHLGLNRKERQAQVECLLGSDWLGDPTLQSQAILCGDFNATPRSSAWANLHQRLPDAQIRLANHRPKNTFFSRIPGARIDHVFVDDSIELLGIETPNTELIRLASDHLPLIVDLNPRLV